MKRLKNSRGLLITLICFVLMAALSIVLLNYTGSRVTQEQADQLRSSLYKAAVNAYAIEGRYPTLDEIQERYGVVIDREHFSVYYDAFASDVLPDIDVRIIQEAR